MVTVDEFRRTAGPAGVSGCTAFAVLASLPVSVLLLVLFLFGDAAWKESPGRHWIDTSLFLVALLVPPTLAAGAAVLLFGHRWRRRTVLTAVATLALAWASYRVWLHLIL
jgi:hypothetical protein